MTERILTKDLKIITDNHEGRIIQLESTKETLNDHIKKHDDVLDPMLKKHERALYGEHGDDGITFTLKQIQHALDEKNDTNKWLLRLMAGTIITTILTAIMNIIMK